MIDPDKYGTASEVAEAVGVARTTLITAAKRGEITHWQNAFARRSSGKKVGERHAKDGTEAQDLDTGNVTNHAVAACDFPLAKRDVRNSRAFDCLSAMPSKCQFCDKPASHYCERVKPGRKKNEDQ